MLAYYSASMAEFKNDKDDNIIGILALAHNHALEHQQKYAWLEQVKILKHQLIDIEDGHIFFELFIPRMGKRADCVLLTKGIIFVLEFKVGSSTFDSYAIDQTHDYALDLKNFHSGSHELPIVPILIATNAPATSRAENCIWAADNVANPILVGKSDLQRVLITTLKTHAFPTINVNTWATAGYKPTPTIIEAAQALYQNHSVQDISRSDAGAKNLQTTANRINAIIDDAKAKKIKSICFITGVPGAGKTLAGLNIATKHAETHEDEHAVFLSGNGPLVDVLREALARDEVERTRCKKNVSDQNVSAFIQNIHHFRDEYLSDPKAPYEKIVVFDEAQRAWTQEQASKFMHNKKGIAGFNQSEPEFLISVMDRHDDWCTIVCLIGGGQEINTGEAGIAEWLNALKNKFPHWNIHASNVLKDHHYTISSDAVALLQNPAIQKHQDLHLSVSMRSFRAEQLSSFIGSVLDGNSHEATQQFKSLGDNYPIWVTRDLSSARAWLKKVSRGTERYGLVASSGAHRLRAEGIHIKAEITPAAWFLNNKHDVRSSYYMEEVATEFDVQGLELDWVGMCWDANLRFKSGAWESYDFRGNKWLQIKADQRKLYLLNAYRVLLTRARQGMVIFVPKGSLDDPTRSPEFYDETYQFLLECGLIESSDFI